jgi:hypothetical protein
VINGMPMKSVYKTCRFCAGGRATCVICGGTGRREHADGNICPSYRGSGRVVCARCGGMGGTWEMDIIPLVSL